MYKLDHQIFALKPSKLEIMSKVIAFFSLKAAWTTIFSYDFIRNRMKNFKNQLCPFVLKY